MTLLRYDINELRSKLEMLRPVSRVAFALACAERARPAYISFCARGGLGDLDAYTNIFEQVWHDLEGESAVALELKKLAEQCEELIPNIEALAAQPELAAAEDAVASLCYAVRCRQNGLAQEAEWSARRVYDAIDRCVMVGQKIAVHLPGAEERILSHPLIQAELRCQQRDIDELASGSLSLKALRDRARGELIDFSGVTAA